MFESIQIDSFKQGLPFIKKALLLTHAYPDFDAIGSVLAMNQQLKKRGVHTCVCVPDFAEAMFSFLPGSEELVREIPKIGRAHV